MWLRGAPSILGEEAQDLLVHRAQVEDAVHPGLQLRAPLFDGLHAVATAEPCEGRPVGAGLENARAGSWGSHMSCSGTARHIRPGGHLPTCTPTSPSATCACGGHHNPTPVLGGGGGRGGRVAQRRELGEALGHAPLLLGGRAAQQQVVSGVAFLQPGTLYDHRRREELPVVAVLRHHAARAGPRGQRNPHGRQLRS